MPTLNEKHPDFKLTYALALIEHLGLNLYSEVHAAISELVANAFDAEAKSVSVRLPIDVPLGKDGQEIVIDDDGHGMTYKECRDKYLRIGRNRRRASSRSKNRLRKVIGKKGIGKLAGFGIANEMTISTISDGKHTEFTLSFQEIERAPVVSPSGGRVKKERTTKVATDERKDDERGDAVREYKPKLLRVDQPTELANGTTVTLQRLRQLDAIDLDEFDAQLTRKFAIFDKDFAVTLYDGNASQGRTLSKFNVPCEFRFPDSGWSEESVKGPTSGRQKVKYWIGFTKGTIKDPAVRGIAVIANGKSVQEPFDFRITGGAHGQFGLQYMTGEVQADWLDDRHIDVIASDRSSIRWSDPDARALLEWGRDKIRNLLDKWVKLRAAATTAKLRLTEPDIYAEIERYKGAARDELEKLVDRVVTVMAPLGGERTKSVIRSVVGGFAHEHIRDVLNRVVESEQGLDLFVQALEEWDLVDAVLTFQELSVKMEAIRTLRILIDAGATEVKSASGHMSLSEHLAAHPWLIDPMFREMHHELNVDNFTELRSGRSATKDEKRADFIALYDSSRVRLVELKSAKDPVDLRGLNNLTTYHRRLKMSEAKRDQARNVRSLLIYNGVVTKDAEGTLDVIRAQRDEFEVLTWGELFDRNTMIYKEQLKYLREKNPTDPRVVPLWELLQNRDRPALGRVDQTHRTGVKKASKKSRGKKPASRKRR